jgi:hypothetical protein
VSGRRDRLLADVVSAKSQKVVEQRRDVLPGHRVHRDERHIQIAGAGVHHRSNVRAEPVHASRQPVEVALNFEQSNECELHDRS